MPNFTPFEWLSILALTFIWLALHGIQKSIAIAGQMISTALEKIAESNGNAKNPQSYYDEIPPYGGNDM